MTLLEYLSHWVESERPTLNALGKLHYRVSPDDGRDKPSAHVAVVREGYSAELIVWSSGEAEFGYRGSNCEYCSPNQWGVWFHGGLTF